MTPPQPRKVGEVVGCPFCGEPPFVGPLDPQNEGGAWTEIRCQNHSCHVVAGVECYGESSHRDRAIATWNTRAVTAELEALRVDAERYRWLRNPGHATVYARDDVNWNGAPSGGGGYFRYEKPEQLDAAIDAALALRDKESGE